ncbi:MAG: hypothetical protein K2I00_09120 [Ruminococcus sp.]|nr:hypothetical protein [Ruminococcus sp.]
MTDREAVIFMVFIILIIVVTACSSNSNAQPEEKPPPKPDPGKDKQNKFARDILRGNTTPEKIVEKNGYDIEHVKQWVSNYEKAAVQAALEADKTSTRIKLMEEDIEWFKKTCHKFIGDDWETKTDFANRFVTKHMK